MFGMVFEATEKNSEGQTPRTNLRDKDSGRISSSLRCSLSPVCPAATRTTIQNRTASKEASSSGEDRVNDMWRQDRRRDPGRKAACRTDRQQADGRHASAPGLARAANRPPSGSPETRVDPRPLPPLTRLPPSRRNPGAPHRHDKTSTVNADSFVIALRRLTA